MPQNMYLMRSVLRARSTSRYYVGTSFGMGDAEKSAWDPVAKFAYAVSEQSIVRVIDYSSPASPTEAFKIEYDGAVR